MTQEGRVIKCDGENTYIEVIRASACAHDCSKCGSACHEKKQVVVSVYNEAGAKEGDFVIIESSTKTVLKQAFIVYMLPLIMFLATYIVMQGLRFSGAVSVGVSCLILGITIASIMRYDKRVKHKDEKPTVIKII